MNYLGVNGARNKTHCSKGHEFTLENIHRNPTTGARRCKICYDEDRLLRYEKQKLERYKRKERDLEESIRSHFNCGHSVLGNSIFKRADSRYATCETCFHINNRKRQLTRRTRKKNKFVEYVDPRVLYERDGGICGICKTQVHMNNFHVDHIIPLSRGGKHSYENTQIAHQHCNQVKHNKTNFSINNQ